MICNQYFTTRYMCNMCTISVICITEFTHKQHTYWVPDMCVITKYHTHILHISYTYLAPDIYPITLILTCARRPNAEVEPVTYKKKFRSFSSKLTRPTNLPNGSREETYKKKMKC